jgi:DNA-binding NarL/FixJ family response regulator
MQVHIDGTEFVRQLLAGRWEFRERDWQGTTRIFRFTPARRPPLARTTQALVALAACGASNEELSYLLGILASGVSIHLSAACARLSAERLDIVAIGPLLVAPEATTTSVVRQGAGVSLALCAADATWRPLTPAERGIAKLVADSHPTSHIAQVRRRSERTIANQLAAMYRKLGVRCRRELILRLYGGTLVPVDESALARVDRALSERPGLAAAG